jgi:S-(hydroxymethyl)glutathione dehydrogenase/alcohol dehydrogenase
MRAVVLREPGSSPQLLDVDLAGPGPGEVRVRIAAAGVCHSDLHVVQGDWPLPMPLVLGHEGSGTVVEVGEDVTSLAVGDPVVLSWVAPCGRCRHCRAGHEARCELAATVVGPGGVLADGTSRLSLDGGRLFHYLGVSSFAEEAVVPASGAIKVRPDVDLEQAALLGCAVATGVGAVRNTAAVEPGASVVVIGCGGVGLSVVQGARLAGAERIVAVDLVAAKTEVARLVGATDAVVPDATTDVVDAVRALLPEGVDYAFDAIGHIRTTEQAIAMLGLGGAAVVVGLPPSGATASFEPLSLAEADQRILGSNYGGIRPAVDIPRLVDDVVGGRILLDPLVSGRRPLADAGHALEELAGGSVLRTLLVPELRS